MPQDEASESLFPFPQLWVISDLALTKDATKNNLLLTFRTGASVIFKTNSQK